MLNQTSLTLVGNKWDFNNLQTTTKKFKMLSRLELLDDYLEYVGR
jgi:hypothetical protein